MIIDYSIFLKGGICWHQKIDQPFVIINKQKYGVGKNSLVKQSTTWRELTTRQGRHWQHSESYQWEHKSRLGKLIDKTIDSGQLIQNIIARWSYFLPLL